MLNFLIKYFINSKIPHNKINVEELLYDKEVYPQYLVTKSTLNFALKNGFLNRHDILQVKIMLNKALFKHQHLKDYKYYKFKNDAHEIYTKMQSKYLSKKQLLKLDKYINSIVLVKSQQIGTFVPTSNISQS